VSGAQLLPALSNETKTVNGHEQTVQSSHQLAAAAAAVAAVAAQANARKAPHHVVVISNGYMPGRLTLTA
jgi:hypothetical protein